MALYKEIVEDNGVVSKYFRISNISFNIDCKNISVGVKEYADSTYRDKEKEIRKIQEDINNRQSEINTLNEDYRNNEEEILKKHKEMAVLVNELNEFNTKNYFVGDIQYNFVFEDKDYSMSDCYYLLIELDVFEDSVVVYKEVYLLLF